MYEEQERARQLSNFLWFDFPAESQPTHPQDRMWAHCCIKQVEVCSGSPDITTSFDLSCGSPAVDADTLLQGFYARHSAFALKDGFPIFQYQQEKNSCLSCWF